MDSIIEKEGDSHEWVYTAKNGIAYNCKMRRNETLLTWCGYVEVTIDNSLHEKHYDDLDLDVHGGITFSDYMDNNWSFGFDCAHYNDMIPFYVKLLKNEFGNTYRTKEYVISETESLAEQISKYSTSAARNDLIDKIIDK